MKWILGRYTLIGSLALLLLCLLGSICTTAEAEIVIDQSTIRQDVYPLSEKQWQWGEAWGEQRQYFPRYFKPSATIHLFVHNAGNEEVSIESLEFNGVPIKDVTTRADYAGPVIWYRINPEKLKPGQHGMVYVRLRDLPKSPAKIALKTSQGKRLTVTLKPEDIQQIRLAYVGFSKSIDKLYVYVEKLDESEQSIRSIILDGKDVTGRSLVFNGNFETGLSLIEVSLDTPLSYGNYHSIRVETQQGSVAMHQVRARDNRFLIGMVGGNYKAYYSKFFNMVYRLHGSFPKKQNWWDENADYAKLGFTILQPAPSDEAIKAGATAPAGRIIYGNVDEPDAHEPAGLEYMLRSGINIMRQVEPVMRRQRSGDLNHETAVMIDRTYAPMNWLNYGEVPDLVFNDIYAPTQWGGYSLEVFGHTMDALRSAVSPRPTHIMLWGGMNTGYPMRRSVTPEENDMSVHYVIGGGAKGLHYFLDWNSFPTKLEGGYFVGAPRTNMLWKGMGRVNAKLTRIGRLLAIGHPIPIVESNSGELWARSILCGKDNIVLVMVNRNHRINVEDRLTKQPHVHPVDKAEVSIDLPDWFKVASAVQVKHDGVYPIKLTGQGQKRRLTVKNLRTSMVCLLSQNPNIADSLQLDEKQYAAMLESEKPLLVTDNAPVENLQDGEAVIRLSDADLKAGKFTLDLTDSAVLAKATKIDTEGALKLLPGKWLGLFPRKNWHGKSEIVFKIHSDKPLRKASAKLLSQTPNFAACANNTVGISFDGKKYVNDCSFKTNWNGGAYRESLSASKVPSDKESRNTIYVRIVMKDPGIVHSDEATNIIQRVIVAFETGQE